MQQFNPDTRERVESLAADVLASIKAQPSRNVPALRAIRRDLSKQIKDESAAFVLEVAEAILKERTIDARFIAYEVINCHKAALSSLNAKRLESLGDGIDSWAAVDTFACYLSGPAWRDGQVNDAVIRRWARSSDRWWRRAALVSTVPVNRKAGRGEGMRTLDICKTLMNDRDDMVVKALSWALRELSKRDPAAVTDFLAEHEKTLAPRVLREVGNKLRTGLKTPRSK